MRDALKLEQQEMYRRKSFDIARALVAGDNESKRVIEAVTGCLGGVHDARTCEMECRRVDERLPIPHLGSKGAYLKQQMQDKLIEHKHYY